MKQGQHTVSPILGLLLACIAVPVAAEVHRDISYDGLPATSGARRLDIYTPSVPAESALPVFVYVHGGGWSHGDKARVGGKPKWLTGQGIILVSVGYRLMPEGRHPAAVVDLAAALDWIVAHIADFGGDPDALFLIGHSSGGHAISLLATDERFLAHHQLSRGLLKGVVCLDTNSFDLETLLRALPVEERQRYLDVFGSDSSGWRDASPAHYVAVGNEIPPFLLLVAGADESSHGLSGRFARRLAAAGSDVTLTVFPDETHSSINAGLGGAAHPPTRNVERFARRLLRLFPSQSSRR